MDAGKSLSSASTEDLLREAASRQDLPDAAGRLGGAALFFEAAAPEWHVALPADPALKRRFGRTTDAAVIK